jgi:hypothetical protein
MRVAKSLMPMRLANTMLTKDIDDLLSLFFLSQYRHDPALSEF